MYSYAASSAAATASVTPFTAAPQTTNGAGLAAQAAASSQSAGSSIGTGAQSVLSQLTSSIPGALQSLASPLSSALGGTSSGGTVTGPLGNISSGSILSSVISSYATMPGWLAIGLFSGLTSTMVGSTFGPLMGSSMNLVFTPAVVAGT